jgi:outer membrane protein assembly factor BamB
LAAASSAEQAGDLTTAVEQYAALAKRYWMVRFENVFMLPLHVETVPVGARIAINGRDHGVTPVQVRYGWGSQTTLTVEAPGFEVATEVLRTADEVPRAHTTIRLVPKQRWTSKIDAGVLTRPIAVGDDVLVVDRSGRATLVSGRDGHVEWTRQVKALEGIRHRAAYAGGVLALPFTDGRLHFLSPRDGTILEVADVGRPAGDAATLGDWVAVPNATRQLVGFVGRRPAFRTTLHGDVTAGAVAAHGAFWVGSAEGDVERVDPATGQVRRITLDVARSTVVGLAAHAEGLLATTGDGHLFALAKDGTLRWHTEGLGDVVGLPAAAGSVAACTDRRGRVLLFDLASGQPRGQLLLEAEPIGGLLAIRGLLVATLQDGRLYVYDAVASRTVADAPFSGASPGFPPGQVSDDRLAVAARDLSLAVVDVGPFAPPSATPQR